MRVLIVSAALAMATAAASAQDRNTGWSWGSPAVSTTKADPATTAPRSVLDRLHLSQPDTPAADDERRRNWLEKFENRGRGGNGGEGGGGDAGAGGHG